MEHEDNAVQAHRAASGWWEGVLPGSGPKTADGRWRDMGWDGVGSGGVGQGMK